MTALNFAITNEGIFLATDTLVTRDSRPLMFTAKVLALPHLHGLITGTGSMILLQRWSMAVLGRILTTHMHHLDLEAPGSIREIWGEMSDEERGDAAEIYHLSYDPDDDQFGGFAYRSSNDFESEPLGYGLYPESALRGAFPIIAFPGDCVRACRRLRFAQEKLDPDKRLQIGGQVTAYSIQRHEVQGLLRSSLITAQAVFEFEDFEDTLFDCDERTIAGWYV